MQNVLQNNKFQNEKSNEHKVKNSGESYMLKKIIAHILLLPYNILCFLMVAVIAIVGGATRNYQARELAESIENKRKSTGLFVFIQILVFVISIASTKPVGVVIGGGFVAISILGKYLLSNSGASFYQSASHSDYQLNYSSNSNDADYYQQNQYQGQNRNDEERRRQDAERDRQRREQQEYYERQQRESQQRHDEQMRRDEESRRRNWEEQDRRRDEQNRKNSGRF